MILNVDSNVQEQENKPKTRKESWWGVRYYQFRLSALAFDYAKILSVPFYPFSSAQTEHTPPRQSKQNVFVGIINATVADLFDGVECAPFELS